ncbi:hypothetical protein P3342_003353 [Pyrenophora teres f. teres]|nr:hypothetical protein P3342_003353 [Pyrenophora teres f. teres]
MGSLAMDEKEKKFLLTTYSALTAEWAFNYLPLSQYDWSREHLYDLVSTHEDRYGQAEKVAHFNNHKRRRIE